MEAFSLLKYWKGGGRGGGGGVCVGSTPHSTECGSTRTILGALAHQQQTSCCDEYGEEEAAGCGDDGPFFDLEFTLPEEDDEDEDEEEVGDGGGEKGEVVMLKELKTEATAERLKTTADDRVTRTTLQCCRKSFVAERIIERIELESEIDDTVSQRGDLKVVLPSSSSSSSCGSSGGCYERSDPNLTLSPSDELFFHSDEQDQMVKESSSATSPPPLVLESDSTDSSKPPQIAAISLLKSATKLRILMSGLKSMKQSQKGQQPKQSHDDNTGHKNEEAEQPPPQEKSHHKERNKGRQNRKFFTVKFKVEEVPIVSFFTTKDNNNNNPLAPSPLDTISCSSSSSSSAEAPTAEMTITPDKGNCLEESTSSSEENKRNLARGEKVQKYLKMVKPLYIRVSKRYGEKLGLGLGSPASSSETTPKTDDKESSDPSPKSTKAAEPEPPETEEKISGVGGGATQKQQQTGANLAVGFRVMRKRLGKSKSASSSSSIPTAATTSKRRDDSLIQQQDGIQGAILHCKRSLVHSNGSNDTTTISKVEAEETSISSSVLSRSVSGPLAK